MKSMTVTKQENPNKDVSLLRNQFIQAINSQHTDLPSIIEAIALTLIDIGLSSMSIDTLNPEQLKAILEHHKSMPTLASACVLQGASMNNWLTTESILNTSFSKNLR